MKNAIVVFLFLVSGLVSAAVPAEKFDFVFNEVKVTQLARVILGEVAGFSFALESDFLAVQDEITVTLHQLTIPQAVEWFERVLAARGFSLDRAGGVYLVTKAKIPEDQDREVFFYRVKFRHVSYIAELVGALFPRGRFSFARGPVSGVAGVPQQPGGAALNRPGAVAGAGQGSGGAIQPGYSPGVAVGAGGVSGMGSAVGGVDPVSDAFFFTGPARDVAALRSLLAQIDVASGEVLVKGLVYEVTVGSQDASAVSIAANVLGGHLGVTFGPSALPNAFNITAFGLNAIASALSSDSRFKTLSAPSLRVKSGSSARLTVGNETPVLGAVAFQQGGTSVQSVDYRSSGVILDLKPQVRDEGIELTVFQQLSSFAPTSTGVNSSPTLAKREISTTVGVVDGALVVIGGLQDERASTARSGFSWLPDFLGSKTGTTDRVEVLLILDVKRM